MGVRKRRRHYQWESLLEGFLEAVTGPSMAPKTSVTRFTWKEGTGDSRAGLQGVGSCVLPAL